jgi:hypothetical protein
MTASPQAHALSLRSSHLWGLLSDIAEAIFHRRSSLSFSLRSSVILFPDSDVMLIDFFAE